LDRRRVGAGGTAAQGGLYMALLVAIGIGLHNLGEGLAIGTSYATGALALGAFLVVGFALHNTTEGLAIVAPIAHYRPSLKRLALLGPIAQVIVQLSPTLRDGKGRTLHPAAVGGLMTGMALMFATGLLVTV